MSTINEEQRQHLTQLTSAIRERSNPLGVGLRNQCWAGVAIMQARQANVPATTYFGLTFKEIKNAIKRNNATPEQERNRIMSEWTALMSQRSA